jgi:hypothetical protein
MLGPILSQRMYPHLTYISIPVYGYPVTTMHAGLKLSQRMYPMVHGYPLAC